MPVSEELAAELETAADEAVAESKENRVAELKDPDAQQEDVAESDGGESKVDEDSQAADVSQGEEVPVDDRSTVVPEGEDETGDQNGQAPGKGTGDKPENTQLLSRAVQAGLTYEEARSFTSEEELALTCDALERAAEAVARKSLETRMDGTEDTKQEEDDPLKIFDNLDTDEYDSDAANMLKVLADQVRVQREELRELRSGNEAATLASQEVQAREVEKWFDGQVEGLGPGFESTLGTGSYGSLVPGSPQLVKRDAIADQMYVLVAGHKQLGRESPSREDLFSQAASLVLKSELATAEQKKLQGKLGKRSRQHIQRAGGPGQKSETRTPEEEAADMLREKFGA